MFEKLHKREFEKHYERLDSICRHMENKVESAIPAMKYTVETGLRGKADSNELKRMQEDKASQAVVDVLSKRLNKLEDKIKFEGGGYGDKASLSGSEEGSYEEDESKKESNP